jgi:hypothetical protein
MTMDRLFPTQQLLEGSIFPILEVSESAHTANEAGTTEVPPAAHIKQDKDGSLISAEYVYILVGAAFSMLSIFFGVVLLILLVFR